MNHNNCERLVLGTAQLGMPYGIANRCGQPDQATATAIVRQAWECGIREFDTAQGYGTSEQTLGKAFSKIGISHEARIISKLDPHLDPLNPYVMESAIDGSLRRLGVPHLFGIMLHREEILPLWNKGLSEILQGFVLSGKVRRLGVSVYSPGKALEALETVGIDFIQVPSNIFDRRFEEKGVFCFANQRNKEVYVRSVFLQGLILMAAKEVPDAIASAEPLLEKLDSLSVDLGLSRQEIALGYVKSQLPDSRIVLGTENHLQIKENVTIWKKSVPELLGTRVRSAFANVSEHILNPSMWFC